MGLDVYDRGWKSGLQAAIDHVADKERRSSGLGQAEVSEVLDEVAGELLQLKRDFLKEVG